MIDTHFKSEQNQFLHLDTEKILSSPLYILISCQSMPGVPSGIMLNVSLINFA